MDPVHEDTHIALLEVFVASIYQMLYGTRLQMVYSVV